MRTERQPGRATARCRDRAARPTASPRARSPRPPATPSAARSTAPMPSTVPAPAGAERPTGAHSGHVARAQLSRTFAPTAPSRPTRPGMVQADGAGRRGRQPRGRAARRQPHGSLPGRRCRLDASPQGAGSHRHDAPTAECARRPTDRSSVTGQGSTMRLQPLRTIDGLVLSTAPHRTVLQVELARHPRMEVVLQHAVLAPRTSRRLRYSTVPQVLVLSELSRGRRRIFRRWINEFPRESRDARSQETTLRQRAGRPRPSGRADPRTGAGPER